MRYTINDSYHKCTSPTVSPRNKKKVHLLQRGPPVIIIWTDHPLTLPSPFGLLYGAQPICSKLGPLVKIHGKGSAINMKGGPQPRLIH